MSRIKQVVPALVVPALVVALLCGAFVSNGLADGGCCDQCGCEAQCGKVCRLVCEEKTIEVKCFKCECKDFCVPGRSCRDCKQCKEVCNEECCCDPAKKVAWYKWLPNCATLRTKKVLMVKTVKVKVPSFKWVVEDLCGGCEAVAEGADVPKGSEVPPVPEVDATFKYGRPIDVPVAVETPLKSKTSQHRKISFSEAG